MQQQDLAGGGAAARRVDCDVCRRTTPSLVFEDRIFADRVSVRTHDVHARRLCPGLYMKRTRKVRGPLCVLIMDSGPRSTSWVVTALWPLSLNA